MILLIRCCSALVTQTKAFYVSYEGPNIKFGHAKAAVGDFCSRHRWNTLEPAFSKTYGTIYDADVSADSIFIYEESSPLLDHMSCLQQTKSP